MMFPVNSNTRVETPPSGRYHMWWRTESGEPFATAAVRSDIRLAYTSLSGVEAMAFPAILGVAEVPAALRGNVALLLTPPSGLSFILSSDAENGVRLHFSPESTSAEQRDAVWREFASFAEAFRSRLNRSILFRARKHFLRKEAALWWRNTDHVVVSLESSNDPPQAVGTLIIGDPGCLTPGSTGLAALAG